MSASTAVTGDLQPSPVSTQAGLRLKVMSEIVGHGEYFHACQVP